VAHHGTILFGHGSRDPLWRLPIEAVARRMQELQPDTRVQCAYLELSTPDLATAADTLVAQGCRSITVLPMFLGTGRHAREDLPVLLAELREHYPRVHFVQKPAIGEMASVIDLMAREALRTPSM
jgi:sirohydrochlorin cobaltochelatase